VGYTVVMWLALLLSACAPEAPRVDYDERSEMAGATLMFTAFNNYQCTAQWLDGATGDTLWERDCDPLHRIVRVKLSRDRRSIVYASQLEDHVLEPEGHIVRVPLGVGNITVTPAPQLHHDFVETDDGFAYLSYETADTFVGPTWATVATDQVLEVPEGGGEERLVWSFLQDYPQPLDWSCAHMRRDGWLPGYREWTHTNSLVEHPDGEHYLLLPRYFDAIVSVARDGSGMHWQFGGEHSDFPSLPMADRMAHGHFSQAFDDRLLVFDNGTGHGPLDRDHSRVVEYRLDEQGRRAELVWSYDDPRGWVTGFLGDAKRLPGGNTLVVWSSTGLLTEVDPTGEVVWELKLPYQLNLGRVEVYGLEEL
jgi:hypothetical protein